MKLQRHRLISGLMIVAAIALSSLSVLELVSDKIAQIVTMTLAVLMSGAGGFSKIREVIHTLTAEQDASDQHPARRKSNDDDFPTP